MAALGDEYEGHRDPAGPSKKNAGDPLLGDEESPVDGWELNDVMDKIGNGTYQVGIGMVCGLSQLAAGMQQLSVGFLIHFLGNVFQLSNHAKAHIGTVSGAGMLIGSSAFGHASDLWGRRLAFTSSLLMAGVFGMLCAASSGLESFLLFRGLLSVGVGGFVPLSFTIFTEFSASHNRGGYLTMLEAFWALGAVLSCTMAWLMLSQYGWQWFVVAVTAPGLLLGIVAYFLMPETPRYLLVTGEAGKAERVVNDIARHNLSDLEDVKLVHVDANLEESAFKALFSPAVRGRTLTLFAVYFLLAFGCGVFVWMPVLLQAKQLEVMSMYRSMVIMALSQVPGVVLASYVVETFGRKKAIALFFVMGAVSCVCFAISMSETLIVASSIMMEFFLAGANGAVSAYTVELYPTTLRSSAMGACSSVSRLSSVINPTIWATLLDIGQETAVCTGGLSLFLGFLLVWFLPETKGMSLQDRVVKKR